MQGVLALGNLPRVYDELVGRDEEVDQLATLLRERQLVTLTGTGGVGKTRTALEVARTMADDYPGGAWLIPLVDVADPDLVSQTVATTLGVVDNGEAASEALLRELLAQQELLLLIDNCEQIATWYAERG